MHTILWNKLKTKRSNVIKLFFSGMFRACPSVPQDYKDKESKLANIYKPIIVDPVMSTKEKAKHMDEWYKIGRSFLK